MSNAVRPEGAQIFVWEVMATKTKKPRQNEHGYPSLILMGFELKERSLRENGPLEAYRVRFLNALRVVGGYDGRSARSNAGAGHRFGV